MYALQRNNSVLKLFLILSFVFLLCWPSLHLIVKVSHSQFIKGNDWEQTITAIGAPIAQLLGPAAVLIRHFRPHSTSLTRTCCWCSRLNTPAAQIKLTLSSCINPKYSLQISKRMWYGHLSLKVQIFLNIRKHLKMPNSRGLEYRMLLLAGNLKHHVKE